MAKTKTKQMAVPRFSSEGEEAAWWDAHRSEVEAEIRQRTKQKRPLTLGNLIQGAKASQPITLRIPKEDLETARRLAAQKGLGYQTYIKMMLREDLAKNKAAAAGPQEGDLLVPFESQNLPTEYKEYYKVRRGNFFASIQRFSEMWKYYTLLDKIWLLEFADLKPARDPDRMFPLMLYINSHAKLRIAVELGFSGCMSEARSILRDAVEFIAHAHHMLKDPEYQKAWLNKNEDEEAFTEHFWASKKTRLFAGLDELYRVWGDLSETGSHANINAMCDRFVTISGDGNLEFRLSYTGLEERTWAMSLFSMLLTCFTMEETMFKDYITRLQFDEELLRMRGEFERYKEQLRRLLIVRYQVPRPPSPTSVLTR